MNIDILLIRSLRKGANSLREDIRQRLCAYVHNQMSRNTIFMNRANKEDIYYTMFGWLLCYILDIKTDRNIRKEYLASIQKDNLDSLHLIVYNQCILLDHLLSYGFVLAAMMHVKDKDHIENFFEQFDQHTQGTTLNGIATKVWTGGKSHRTDNLMQIASLQDETGGFYQSEAAQIPDILSTAVALFTLKSFSVNPVYKAEDFIVAHVNDDGSFAPNLIDIQSDVEYCFYGLLALGCYAK